MSNRPHQAEDRAAADRIIGAIRCESSDPYCGASVSNEAAVRKVILQELVRARLDTAKAMLLKASAAVSES